MSKKIEISETNTQNNRIAGFLAQAFVFTVVVCAALIVIAVTSAILVSIVRLVGG